MMVQANAGIPTAMAPGALANAGSQQPSAIAGAGAVAGAAASVLGSEGANLVAWAAGSTQLVAPNAGGLQSDAS